MADVSKHGTNPWVAFLAGAVALLAVVLIVFGWQGGERAAEGVAVALRDAHGLPKLPPMPEGPRLPDPPIPRPQ